jgi:2-polyprenyl-6-methoxyphenol hydroxylase-like FAD-dependent oxidoreductase
VGTVLTDSRLRWCDGATWTTASSDDIDHVGARDAIHPIRVMTQAEWCDRLVHMKQDGSPVVRGSRVGIVGGSIAGCATAIALRRLGCEVTVFERSAGELADRGSGIVVPLPLRDELVAANYLPARYRSCALAGRWWVIADGSPSGRQLWDQPGEAVANNWSVLWRSLRRQVPDHCYHRDARIDAVTDTGDGAEVATGSGVERFDVVIGADGYRSVVRAQLNPGSAPRPAGYAMWRGNFAASRLDVTAAWEELLGSQRWVTVVFDGGHGLVYPIPDFDGDGLRVNWVIYSPWPAGLALDEDEPDSIPPGRVPIPALADYQRLLERHVPARWRPLFDSPSDEISLQPIYDETADRYAAGRIALVGDAATVARPHAASGATKALQDARLLEILGSEHREWAPLLGAYDADRSEFGRSIVELSRRIGLHQVERTPPWGEMTPDDFRAWTATILGGRPHYLYPETH